MAEPLARVRKLCIDALDPGTLGPWWAGVLDLTWRPWPGGEGGLYRGPSEHPEIWFNRVPEPKTVKNRIHLDLTVDDVAQLVDFGATRLGGDVLADPEGNELCALDHADTGRPSAASASELPTSASTR